jgi:hypothetical protein
MLKSWPSLLSLDKLLGEVESKSFFDGSKLVEMNILMHLILTGQ